MYVHDLAGFINNASFEQLSEETVKQLKIRLIDSMGTALGALGGEPIRKLRTMMDDFGGAPRSTLIGGGQTTPDRAAFYNSALVRYLDYNDSYLARGETGHPSDNIGAVLAAAEDADRDGAGLLVAIAIAYHVQCRLSDEAPVRDKGFDHTTQGSYAVAAGVAKALGIGEEEAANAMAIAGTALNALRVTRTGELSNWKGLAYPHTAFGGTHATYLAQYGITGPPEVFEGNKGFMDSISGPFTIEWENEHPDRVKRTILKKYNAEIHSQATLEGVLDLRQAHNIDPSEVDKVVVNTFDVAYNIIGGGEEGDKTIVRRKEEADHSLQYMVAAALLDGQVMPQQYEQSRIESDDIQQLLKRVEVYPNEKYSRCFPDLMPCDITIHLKNGQKFHKEKRDYEGFHSRPMSWDTAKDKFEQLASDYAGDSLRKQLVDTIAHIEQHKVKDLTQLLARVGKAER